MLLFAFSVTTYNANAQVAAKTTKVSEEYKKELARYYSLSGQDASITAAVDGIVKMMANLPEAQRVNLKKDLLEKVIREMMESLSPIYEKNISLADLKAMNKFYSEGAGKRISEAMPKMTEEIMAASMQLGQKMQQLLQESMQK